VRNLHGRLRPGVHADDGGDGVEPDNATDWSPLAVMTVGARKGVRMVLSERPYGCFAQNHSDTFSRSAQRTIPGSLRPHRDKPRRGGRNCRRYCHGPLVLPDTKKLLTKTPFVEYASDNP
jgi:hypothetical protein